MLPYRVVYYTDATARGGAETCLGNLLAALPGWVEPSVLGVDREVAEWVAGYRPGTPVHVVRPVRGKKDLTPIVDHLRLIRRLRPDLLQANLRQPWSCQYGVAAALLTPGVGVVAVEHLPLPSSSQVQRMAKRLASAHLSAHVAVGDHSAREVERLAGLPSGTVRTIRNGVPPWPPAPSAGRYPPVVGTVGRLDPQKGIDVLIRAMGDVEANLVVVGDGPERANLEQLAAQVGVSDRVEFTGWSAEPRRWLEHFDVLALASRQEALPLTILEAMFAGLPVVATDVGSVAEAVRPENGVLVAPEDAGALAGSLRALLAAPELRARLGRRGREIALREFTVEAMAEGYLELYRSLR